MCCLDVWWHWQRFLRPTTGRPSSSVFYQAWVPRPKQLSLSSRSSTGLAYPWGAVSVPFQPAELSKQGNHSLLGIRQHPHYYHERCRPQLLVVHPVPEDNPPVAQHRVPCPRRRLRVHVTRKLLWSHLPDVACHKSGFPHNTGAGLPPTMEWIGGDWNTHTNGSDLLQVGPTERGEPSGLVLFHTLCTCLAQGPLLKVWNH